MKGLIFLIIFSVYGCASQEAIKSQVTKPFVGVNDQAFNQVLNGQSRSIASVKNQSELDLEKPSMKRVYFKVLYGHFKDMHTSEEVHACPQFHHDKLVIDETHKEKYGYDHHYKKNGHELYSAMKAEIEELCDRGETENYFKVENLSTYFSQHAEFQKNKKSFLTLFKMPIFAAFVMKNKVTDDWSMDERDFISRVGVSNLEKYVYILKNETENKRVEQITQNTKRSL